MSHSIRLGLFALAICALTFLYAGPASGPVHADTTIPRTISVTGTGVSNSPPDVGYLSLGVELFDENPAGGFKKADMQMASIVKTLKANGIAEADIQTDQYSIYRENRQDEKTGKMVNGYRVANTLRVTVRDITKVSDILGLAVEAGANLVNNINFGIRDVKAAETDARKAALADARQRASELAAALGGTLGDVLSISESSYSNSPSGYFADSRGGGGGGGGAGIAGGSIQISISLGVTFELK